MIHDFAIKDPGMHPLSFRNSTARTRRRNVGSGVRLNLSSISSSVYLYEVSASRMGDLSRGSVHMLRHWIYICFSTEVQTVTPRHRITQSEGNQDSNHDYVCRLGRETSEHMHLLKNTRYMQRNLFTLEITRI